MSTILAIVQPFEWNVRWGAIYLPRLITGPTRARPGRFLAWPGRILFRLVGRAGPAFRLGRNIGLHQRYSVQEPQWPLTPVLSTLGMSHSNDIDDGLQLHNIRNSWQIYTEWRKNTTVLDWRHLLLSITSQTAERHNKFFTVGLSSVLAMADTARLSASYSRTTWVSRRQKGYRKSIWILVKQEMTRCKWHQIGLPVDHMQIICTLLQTDNQTLLTFFVNYLQYNGPTSELLVWALACQL